MERDKAAHLSRRCDPQVPDRYKSVHAGQHSSEQVNRASSNPSGGPQSARAQQRLLQMLTSANMNSLVIGKTKLVPQSYAGGCICSSCCALMYRPAPQTGPSGAPTDAVSHLTTVALYKRVKYLKPYIVISGFSMNLGCQVTKVIGLRPMESVEGTPAHFWTHQTRKPSSHTLPTSLERRT